MRWWIRSRRPVVISSTLAGFIIAVATVGGQLVPAPGLLGEVFLPVPLTVYLPMAVVAVVVFGITSTPPEVEAVAVRRTRLFDAGAVLAVAFVTLVVSGSLAVLFGDRAPVEGARNLAGYMGMGMLVLVRYGPRAASFVPAAFAVVSSTFGWRSAVRTLRWWAWPLESTDQLRASVIAGALLVAGVVMLAMTTRRT